MTKNEMLIKRGFTIENINNEFSDIDEKDWCIKTIQKNEITDADPNDPKAMKELYNKLFAKDSVDLVRVGENGYESFLEFADYKTGYSPAASMLEPYIARLIHALNGVGVRTFCSCDGWHTYSEHDLLRKNTRMVIWMPERYSVLWMWLITEYIFGEKWNKSDPLSSYKWKGLWNPKCDKYLFSIPDSESRMECLFPYNGPKEVYDRNDRYAAYIEKETDRLLSVREKMINCLQHEYSNAEITSKGFMEMRRIMHSYIKDDLLKLKK